MDDEQILQAAIDYYGIINQLHMVTEELSELTTAISKFLRVDSIDKVTEIIPNILEETADVEIMTAQIRLLFDNSQSSMIDQIKKYKINRLKTRLEEK